MSNSTIQNHSVTVNGSGETITPQDLLAGLSGPLDYRLTNDYMFRAVLQECPEALEGLVRALLDLDKSEVVSCEILNPIVLGKHIDEKSSILDIRILLNDARYINLEMQVANFEAWPERSLYYLCRLFTNLSVGEGYENVKPAVHIGILDFTPIKEDEEFYSGYLIMNKKTGHVYSDKFALNVLNLSQIEKVPKEQRDSELYTWAKLFKSESWEEIKMLADKSKTVEKVGVTLRNLTAEEEIKLQCEARERYEHDRATYENLKIRLRKQAEDIEKQTLENKKQAEDIGKQALENKKQAEDIKKQLDGLATLQESIEKKEKGLDEKLKELKALELRLSEREKALTSKQP